MAHHLPATHSPGYALEADSVLRQNLPGKLGVLLLYRLGSRCFNPFYDDEGGDPVPWAVADLPKGTMMARTRQKTAVTLTLGNLLM